jgi:hypothetical protein
MSMINFYDLNYELGILLYRTNSKDELRNFRAIVKSLGSSRILLEKIKEGFMDCCKQDNVDINTMEKEFCIKLQLLNLKFVRPIPTTSIGESLFEYIGKEVMVKWSIKHKDKPEIGKGTILDIKFNPEEGDYEIYFIRSIQYDLRKVKNYKGGLYYASDIVITPIESE